MCALMHVCICTGAFIRFLERKLQVAVKPLQGYGSQEAPDQEALLCSFWEKLEKGSTVNTHCYREQGPGNMRSAQLLRNWTSPFQEIQENIKDSDSMGPALHC